MRTFLVVDPEGSLLLEILVALRMAGHQAVFTCGSDKDRCGRPGCEEDCPLIKAFHEQKHPDALIYVVRDTDGAGEAERLFHSNGFQHGIAITAKGYKGRQPGFLNTVPFPQSKQGWFEVLSRL